MLTLVGPAVDRYVAALSRYSGLPLTVTANPVAVAATHADRRGGRLVEIAASPVPPNPFCSQTLQELVREVVRADGPNVHIRAVHDAPNLWIDAFDRPDGTPVRTVSVLDIDTLALSAAPELAPAMIAHVLGEYLHAAGSRRLFFQFRRAHANGLVAEAQVIRDLTGRPIFEGRRRTRDRGSPESGRFLIMYGPGNHYLILIGPGPGFRIRSARWTGDRR